MFQQNDLEKRTNQHDNNVWFGYVVERSEIGTEGVFVRVTDAARGITSGLLPVEQRSTKGLKTVYQPRIGAFVKVENPSSGGREDGIVTGEFYTPTNPPPESASDTIYGKADDGSVVSLNPDNSTLTITTPGGSVTISLGGTLALTITGNATITADANLTANVTGTATITAAQINITGPVKITGTLEVTGNVQFDSTGSITTHLTNIDGQGNGS